MTVYQLEDTTDGLAPGRRGAAGPAAPTGAPDEAAARAALRGQIARLERDLSDTLVEAFGRDAVDVRVPAVARGPRLLDLGELERLRDDLAERLHGARVRVAECGAEHAAHRALLERMLREPGRHRYVRVSLKDLGEPGCGVYQVRPRLGLVGMLAGWWHVKLSSGCPRPQGRRERAGPPRVSKRGGL